MIVVDVLRVFVGPDGAGGNPLGVVLHGAAVPAQLRQPVAADLAFSETVFVDDPGRGAVQIFTPAVELAFAGHPLVGTAWLLRRRGHQVQVLRPPAGEVATWQEDTLTWIRGRAQWAPPMTLERVPDPDAVDVAQAAPDGVDAWYVWAWEDQAAGRVRARFFAPGLGVAEDEATGAAAVRLSHRLQRAITIRQGRGSCLRARPGAGGTVEVGGTVVHDDTRAYRPGS